MNIFRILLWPWNWPSIFITSYYERKHGNKITDDQKDYINNNLYFRLSMWYITGALPGFILGNCNFSTNIAMVCILGFTYDLLRLKILKHKKLWNIFKCV